MSRVYLLTGGTGFLGKVVLEELLRRREELGVERVRLLIRPRGTVTAAERFARDVVPAGCFSRLPSGWQELVEPVSASLEGADLGLDPADAARISGDTTHILHAAASVDFGLPLADAARANIAPTLALLDLARRCPSLQRLVYVSTAYVAPHPGSDVPIEEQLVPLPSNPETLYRDILAGTIEEADLLQACGHPNTYTLTKSLAEHLLLAQRGEVPLAIVRPSIISASRTHPFPGWIDSLSGFAAFVVMLGQGQLRVVRGQWGARLDLVPVDEVAERVLAVAHQAEPTDHPVPIYHAVAGLEHSPTVRQCWHSIRDHFRSHPANGRRPGVWFVGPSGLRARLVHLVEQRLSLLMGPGDQRARRALIAARARFAQVNQVFGYFVERSFAFTTSAPLGRGVEPRDYVSLVCRGVSRHLLGQDDREWLLAGRRHKGYTGDLSWALRQPSGNVVLRGCAWLLAKIFRKTADRITLDQPSFEAARSAVPDGSTLVLVATHRSFFDFILCTYLAFARPDLGIPIPHVAAASEFGRVPILGRLLPLAHAFYLARGPKRESVELRGRIAKLVSAGKTIEFYIEGTRSRTREFLAPKRGLIRCLQETEDSFSLFPIAISFERVPEEKVFLRELTGEAKPRMRFIGFLTWLWEAVSGQVHLGRIHLAAGRPVALTPDRDLKDVSTEVMAQLRGALVSTTWHLRTYLAHYPVEGVDPEWLRREIERRGGRVLESDLPIDPIDPRLARDLRYHFLHLFRPDEPREGTLGRLLDALFEPARPTSPASVSEAVA